MDLGRACESGTTHTTVLIPSLALLYESQSTFTVSYIGATFSLLSETMVEAARFISACLLEKIRGLLPVK
jgi:hypothetical protein